MIKQNEFLDFIAIAIVVLLMLLTVFPNIIIFYAVIGISLLFIKHPIVIFPAYFVASLSNTYFGLSKFAEGGMTVGRFLSPILIVSLLISIYYNRNKTNPGTVMLICLFIAYCFISCCMSVTGSFGSFITIIQSLLVLLLFPMIKDIDLERINRLIWTSSLIVILGMWLYILLGGEMEMLLYSRFNRDGEVNSNRIAMMCVQVGVVLIVPFITGNVKTIKIIPLVGYLLSLVLIFFTGSRTGLIAVIMAPVILFLMLSNSLTNKHKRNHNLLLLIVFGVVLFILFSRLGDLNVKVNSRFSMESVEESGGSGRLKAIQLMWNVIFPEHPIFGVGLGGANFISLSSKYNITYPCHNIIFDSLCQLGLIGFFLFLSLIAIITRPCIKALTRESNTLMVLPLLLLFAAIINGMGETIYLEKFFWNALTLCFVYSTNYKKQINGSI